MLAILLFSVIPVAIEWLRHRRTHAPEAEDRDGDGVPDRDITGMDTAGVANLHGIHLEGDASSLIGGSAPGEGNVIAGGVWGIWLGGIATNRHTTGTRIEGNRIGTNAAGTIARGNSWGIYVEGQSGHEVHDVTIGGRRGQAPGPRRRHVSAAGR